MNASLLCGTYVDLKPYRAGEVDNPVSSRYTSVYQRLQAQGLRKNAAHRPDGGLRAFSRQPERKADETLADFSRSGRRASDLGLLPISLENYVRLLEWTAQQLRSGQHDTIPADLATVRDHFEVQQDEWLDTVERYENPFRRQGRSPDGDAAKDIGRLTILSIEAQNRPAFDSRVTGGSGSPHG